MSKPKISTMPGAVPTAISTGLNMKTRYTVDKTAFAQILTYVNGGSIDGILDNATQSVNSLIDNPMVFPFDLTPYSTGEGVQIPINIGSKTVNGAYSPTLTKATQLIAQYSSGLFTGANGNFLDFEPYTEYRLFLPFVGEIPLSYKDIQDTVIVVKYFCDFDTGLATVYVIAESYNTDPAVGNTIYSSQIQLGAQLSMSIDSTNADKLRAAVKAATGIALSIATKGMVTPSATTRTTEKSSEQYNRGNEKGARVKLMSRSVESTQTTTAIEGGNNAGAKIVSDTINSIQNVMMQQGSAMTVGGVNGSLSSFTTYEKPYIKIIHPRIAEIENYGHYNGYACMDEVLLGEHTGYCEVHNIHLDGFTNATAEELTQIERLLKIGVIL